MTIHEKIKTIRKRLELNQEEFAKKTHVTQEAVSMLEREINKPSYEFLYILINDLKVNPYFLFGDHPQVLQKEKLEPDIIIKQQRAINKSILALQGIIKDLTID